MIISAKAKIAGVIGYPIEHSLSPLMHNYLLEKNNIDGAYIPLSVHPNDLSDFCNYLKKSNLQGVNVTIPHKENIMQYLDDIDGVAQVIGAVNTIYKANGKLIGSNSDAYGFIENLKLAIADLSSSLPKLSDMNVMIIGAGGAARAAIYGLLQENIRIIYLTNRSKERAINLQQIAREKIEIINYVDKEDVLNNVDLLINTTSLGMIGQSELSIDLANLKAKSIVYDIVYNPLHTNLLKQAQDRAHHIVTGIGMLLHQAVVGFTKWYDIEPIINDELAQYLLESQI
ncbi:MAG: shikimate dehydrogenase [Pseudomonadota bacterium]